MLVALVIVLTLVILDFLLLGFLTVAKRDPVPPPHVDRRGGA